MSEQPTFSTREFPVRVGELLAGKYRVERILGNGAMGVVVAAMHEQLEERVAVKLMLSSGMKRPEFVERFLREARASVKIKNSHVARVVDAGKLDDGRLYMVMEYLEGKDLGRVIDERGALPEGDAVAYVLQACEALAEAHGLGIVHRDLKPSNMFLTETSSGSPLVKVLDFGISKVKRDGDPDDSRLTATAAIMGSPTYMSPEQIRSAKDVDARADIWALGVILHELLTARVPFAGDTHMAVLASIAADAPVPLLEHNRNAAPELEEIIKRCLEKEPSKRFASVLELARALSPFASEEAVVSVERAHLAATIGRSSNPGGSTGSGRASTTGTSGSGVRISSAPVDVMAETVHTIAEAKPDKQRQRFVALATVLGGVAAVATAAVLSMRPGPKPDTGSAPTTAASSAAAALTTAATVAPTASQAVEIAPSTAAASASIAPTAPEAATAKPASVTSATAAASATAAVKAAATTVASAKPSLPASSGGIRFGKEIDTRR